MWVVYRIKEQDIRIVTLVEVNEQDRSRRRVQFWEIMDVTSVRMFFEMRIFLKEYLNFASQERKRVFSYFYV